MGHHLLNGVKCVREVGGLTNALIISPSLFMDGGRKHRWRGNDRHRTDVINYHRGVLRRQGLVSLLHSRSKMSFNVSKPSVGIWTENQTSLFLSLSFPDKKGGKCLFFSKERGSHWQDVTCYLSYLSKWKRRCTLKSCFYTLTVEGAWTAGGREGVSHLQPPVCL